MTSPQIGGAILGFRRRDKWKICLKTSLYGERARKEEVHKKRFPIRAERFPSNLANGGENLDRKRFYATEVDGCRAVVDVAEGVVHFDVTVASDITSPEERKFVPTQENISVALGPYQHAEPEKPLNPEEVLQRSISILDNLKLPNNNVLTVGDLTEKKDRKTRAKEARKYLRNMKERLSVGDLTDKEDDERGLDQLFVGRPVIEPAMTESGQIDAERIRRRQEQVDEVLHIRNLLAGARDERLERYLEKYLSNKPKEPLQPAGSGRTNEPKEKA